MKILLALLTVLAAAGSARGQADCRACHTTSSPTKEKPSLVACPRERSKGRLSSAQAPAVITLGSGAGAYGPVRFSHKAHAEMTEMGGDCYRCHHYDQGGRIQRCDACHSRERARADLGKPDVKGAMHRLCVDCHRSWSGSTDCAGCHAGKTASPHRGNTGWMNNRFHGGLECGRCHTTPGKYAKAAKDCESCHKGWRKKFDHKKTGLALDETHAALGCTDCHADSVFAAPPACAACHEKSYPKDKPGKVVGGAGKR